MSERDGYQAGVPCWVAAVHPDPEKAVAFYTELFGWEAEDLMPPGSPGRYFVCTLRGRDVAAIGSPHDIPGFRQAVLADPQGAAFTVSEVTAGNGPSS